MTTISFNSDRRSGLSPFVAFMFAGIYVTLKIALTAIEGVGQAYVEGVSEARPPDLIAEAGIILPYMIIVLVSAVVWGLKMSSTSIHQATKWVALAHIAWLATCLVTFFALGEPFVIFEKTFAYRVISQVSRFVPYTLIVVFFTMWWKSSLRSRKQPAAETSTGL